MAVVLALAATLVAPVAAEDNARGEALYDVCAACHGADGAGDQRFLAPAIAGQRAWYVASQLRKFRSGLRGKHFDDVAGMRMRPMSLSIPSDADVDLLARYVASLKPVKPQTVLMGGDAAKGKATYVLCGTCHGPNGEGVEALFGPRLTHTNDWYLAEQIRKFQLGIRAGNPEDATGIMMRPMAMTLATPEQVRDVLAYISTLSK
ncbi:MAG: cytochrome c [bacterium]|nr:cytochrome c [bacterium]